MAECSTSMRHNRIRSGRHFNLCLFLVFVMSLPFTEEQLLGGNTDKGNLYYHPDHEFVSGRTVEYLTDPIFYETYIPVIYKIPIPRHTESALKLIWGQVELCTKSKAGKLCPIAFHLFKVIKKLGDDMGFWKPYYVNHTTSKKESQKKRSGFEVICNEIGPHFFRSYTTKTQLDNYRTALHACSRIAQQVQLREPSGNWVVDKAVYYEMLESFKKAYFTDLPQKGNVDWAITLNTYTSVHGLLLTNHVMESVRLASALRICQSGMIPETFISIDMLTTALENVSKTLERARMGYQLVYTNLAQDIEEYYKLPLADCTFSDDYTFIIRILAPIKRSEFSHRLVEINAIPFLEKLPNTTGIPTRLCRLKLSASKLTLIETNTGLLLDTRCEPNQLCKTSEISTVFENDACTTSLLTENRQLITNTCKFSCFPVDPVALPLIRRISSDTFVVVGTPNLNAKIFLNCFDKPTELIPIAMKNVGALKIKLACNCHLLYSNHVSYRPRYPCTSKTTVEHILPFHWFTQKINVTLEKYEKELDSGGGSVDFYEPGSSQDQDVNETVGINTTSAPVDLIGKLVDEQIEQSIGKQEEELERKFLPKHEIITRKVISDATSDGMVLQLSILWTLVIILILTSAYLGYHVRKLTKWRQLQAYKDTRILYKIPSETSDESKINRTGSGGTRVAWDAFYDLFTVH